VIRLEHVHRTFAVGDQEVHALDDLDLQVRSGEYVSIMGPSGSGKSTLLNVIGLLDRVNSGIYRLQGRDVTELTDREQALVRQQTVGFVFQFFHLIPRLTAAENIELPMTLAGLEPELRRDRVHAALDALDLGDRGHHRPDQLSGGQRQRVAIARATVLKPALLLADEPTGNLDQASGREVIRSLEALNQDGITLLVVSHDPELAARAARCIHMVDGRITEDSGTDNREPSSP